MVMEFEKINVNGEYKIVTEEELLLDMTRLPEMMLIKEKGILDLTKIQNDLASDLAFCVLIANKDIASKVKEDGKKVYSNEALRKTAFNEFKLNNIDYKMKADRVDKINMQLEVSKLELKFLERKFRGLRAVAYMKGGRNDF